MQKEKERKMAKPECKLHEKALDPDPLSTMSDRTKTECNLSTLQPDMDKKTTSSTDAGKCPLSTEFNEHDGRKQNFPSVYTSTVTCFVIISFAIWYAIHFS